jgi:hypothetical protein
MVRPLLTAAASSGNLPFAMAAPTPPSAYDCDANLALLRNSRLRRIRNPKMS